MSFKALVVIALFLATLANIEAASVSGSVSVSPSVSGSVSGSVSSSVSVSVTGSVSTSTSGSPSHSPVSLASASGVINTCSFPQILCLSWTGSTANTNSFIVYVNGIQMATLGVGNTKLQVTQLTPNTAYAVSVVAVDSFGRQATAATATLTTAIATPKTAPNANGPVKTSLTCAQVTGQAAVKCSWSIQGVTPARVNIQLKCPGKIFRNRKSNVKAGQTSYTFAGLYGIALSKAGKGIIQNCQARLRPFYDKPGQSLNYPIRFVKSNLFPVDTSKIKQ